MRQEEMVEKGVENMVMLMLSQNLERELLTL